MLTISTRFHEPNCDRIGVWSSSREGAEGSKAASPEEYSAAQWKQKIHYDRETRHVDLKEGDLVMLSVQPKFKLDRIFKGPFVI